VGNTLLQVCLRLLKHRNNCDDDSAITFENTVKSDKKHGTLGKVKYLTCLTKKNNGKFDEGDQQHPYESDGSPVFDSDESSNESTTSGGSSSSNSPTESRVSFPSSGTKTNLDSNRRFKGWDTAQLETSTIYQTPFTVCQF